MSDNKQEVYCTNCDWNGKTKALDGIKCPKCGDARYIEDVEKEWRGYDNQVLGGGEFNWNKK